MHMHRAMIAILGAAVLGGCSGNYIMTVPDQVAPAGGDAAAVIRLQRAEIALMALPVEGAAIRFRIAGQLQRGAYTDKLGYAGTTVPAPDKPGKYTLVVEHMDKEGDEINKDVPCYVLDAKRPVIAVDLACLPHYGSAGAVEARDAMQRLAKEAPIVYVTDRAVSEHFNIHQGLALEGFPDGAVLMWQHENYHIVRDGPMKMPRIVVESRLVSQLPTLQKIFPQLKTGITDSPAGARMFAQAGMNVIAIGPAPMEGATVTRCAAWTALDADAVK